VQVTLFAWSYAEIYFYVHSQPLSIGTVELVDDSNSQSENKPAQRSPNKPRRKSNQR